MKFIFEVHIREGHTAEEYADAWVRASEIIQQAPGARGTELHRNAGLAGIAWTVRDSSGFEARFGYDLGFDADRVAHGISVSVNAAW